MSNAPITQSNNHTNHSPGAGYKQTEVGVIPEDWDSSKIGDFAFVTKLAGFEYTLHFDYSKSGPIIAVRALNIKGGALDLQDVHTIPKETSDALPRSKLKKSDLVMSYVGTLGRVAVIPEDERFHLAPNVAKLSVNQEEVTPAFLSHFLNGFQGQKNIFDAAASTTQAALSMRNLRMIFFARPSLAEQRAIADALSDADALIESLEQLIAKRRAVKQGAMQALLTGKRRLPGFQGEWETRPLSQVAPLQRGFDLPNSKLLKGPYPVVYSNGMLNYHNACRVKGPGVVTGRSGTIGTVILVEKDFWPHNTSLWVTSFRGNHPNFIYYLYSRIGFEQFATGSGVPTLNRNDVHAFEVSIPTDKTEQTAIAIVLSDMDAEIDALEAKLAKARQVKQGMMQELLTGRVRLV